MWEWGESLRTLLALPGRWKLPPLPSKRVLRRPALAADDAEDDSASFPLPVPPPSPLRPVDMRSKPRPRPRAETTDAPLVVTPDATDMAGEGGALRLRLPVPVPLDARPGG